jgi:hypothetical protein
MRRGRPKAPLSEKSGGTSGMIWNDEFETLPREALEALQL